MKRELEPTISARPGDVIVNGNPVPIIDSRAVDTTMRVKNGKSIVIGGLKRTDVTKSVVKVPILGDIPILGRRFQTTTDSKSDSEFIIVVMASPRRPSGNRSSRSVPREVPAPPER